MRRRRALRVVVLLTAVVTGSSWGLAEAARDAASPLQQAYPNVRFYIADAQVRRVYGAPFSYGLSVEESAENFVRTYSEVCGVAADELLPGNVFSGQYTQPIGYDGQNRTCTATLVYYHQYQEGIPVYGSELRLLVLNQPAYPLIWAGSSLHDLGDFTPSPAAAAKVAAGAAHAAAVAAMPGLTCFGESELVIWAGAKDVSAPPRLAIRFEADNGPAPATDPQKWHLVADAATGEMLDRENRIVRTDVVGHVQGKATAGVPPKADICNPENPVGLSYAKVAIGNTVVYADASGNFVIPNAGTDPVTVVSYMSGHYFLINDLAGPVETLSLNVVPPGPANFLHNAANTSEFVRAEVNAYVQANVVRDFALVQNPSYPVIAAQTNFPITVDAFNYCGSYYDGSMISLGRAGGGCSNMAFSGIVHHEYGHHLVQCGGSGQGQYGEGMADSIAVLIADDPVFGYGLEGNCNAGVGTAENTIQYPCSGLDSYCGWLLAGCVWDTRQELGATNPSTALQVISKLTVNSILLHIGTEVTPAIYSDFIALDDAFYGGAHQTEITAGFAAHNMVPAPTPPNDDCADAIVACPGQAYSGSTNAANVDGSTTCGTSNSTPDVWYKYTPGTGGPAMFSLCGPGTTYDTVMSIHSACPGTSGNTLNCNDDACGEPYAAPSEITRSVTAGTTYIVRVSGWSGASGNYSLTIDGPACYLDCNGNGVPDDQDIASGTSNDDNGNSVPDECEKLTGDINCDGAVDFGDINPFVLLLSDEAGYLAAFPDCIRINGDISGNGSVGFEDINPFVALLSGE